MGEFNLEPLGPSAHLNEGNKTWTCENGLRGIQCAPLYYHAPLSVISGGSPIVGPNAGRFEFTYANYEKPYLISCEPTEDTRPPSAPNIEMLGQWHSFSTAGITPPSGPNPRDSVSAVGTHQDQLLLSIDVMRPTAERDITSYLYASQTQTWHQIATLTHEGRLPSCPTYSYGQEILSRPNGTFLYIKASGCIYVLKENPYRWEFKLRLEKHRYTPDVAISQTKIFAWHAEANANERAFLFDLETGTRKPITEIGMPTAGGGVSLFVVSNDEFMVWGGAVLNGEVLTNAGDIYHVPSNTWRSVSGGSQVHPPIYSSNSLYHYGTGTTHLINGLPTFLGSWSAPDGYSTALSFYNSQRDQWERFTGDGPHLPLSGYSVFASSPKALFAYAQQPTTAQEVQSQAWLFDVGKNKWFRTPPLPWTFPAYVRQEVMTYQYENGFLFFVKPSESDPLNIYYFKH